MWATEIWSPDPVAVRKRTEPAGIGYRVWRYPGTIRLNPVGLTMLRDDSTGQKRKTYKINRIY